MSTTKHPGENDLALLAGGEAGRLHRFVLERHVRNCEDCQDRIVEFQDLRLQLGSLEFPDSVNWNQLAAEMHANIRVGLEAGECVRPAQVSRGWSPRFTVALASLLLVVGASFFLTDSGIHPVPWQPALLTAGAMPVLQGTGSGIEMRNGRDSFAFLDRQGARAEQTVNAQGAIEARYVNGETGLVTINNVYLQQ
jgi:hypothetical protein